MELNYQSIGRRIKTARIMAGMTQEQLSDKVDVTTGHISNIENGSTRVSLTTLVCLANVLSVTVDDLLCDSVLHTRPQLERDIQACLNQCSDYEMHIVKQIITATIEALRSTERFRNGI